MRIKRDNRERLLEAGLLLLAEKTPEEISMDDVAGRAGVTKPMVYYYFGSKVGFYQHLVKHIEKSLCEMVEECLSPGISFREALRNILAVRIRQTLDQPELANAIRIMATNATICGAESRVRITGMFSRLEPVFQSAQACGEIREDADLHLTMGMMNSLLDGALRVKGIDFIRAIGPERFADKAVQMVFDGIKKRKEDY
jgi:AcrR family transcriptional regulator